MNVLIKLDFVGSFQLELNINLPNIIIFLKQNQMRLLLKSLKDLANYDPKRPILRPVDSLSPEETGISTLNPAR